MTPAILPPPEIEGLSYLTKLGAGGYADVYLYQQAMPSRKVAVKVLRDTGLAGAVWEQFRGEANAMARLEHPNIVPVYATGVTDDKRPYLVMMHYPRASLAQRVKQERLTVAEALRIGIQLCSAVETAHRAGLLHRDIKPANILTSQYGAPGLTDFGIAADAAAASDDDMGVSVPWSPPEILFVTAPASARSDVYSLGATLWHLLVGRSPFEIPGGDNSQFALMRRIRDTPPPATGRADVPASLERLLKATLAKDPAMRPASALELARSLQAVEAEQRLPRTEVVLAADERTISPSPLSGEATRMHGAQRVDAAQGPVEEGTRRRAPEVADHRTRRRQPELAGTEPDPDATRVRRGPAVPDQPADEPTRRRGALWAIGAAVLVAGGVLVWSLFNGASAVVPRPSESFSSPPPSLDAPLPPGPLEITVVRKGQTVTFSWTYANALAGDEFRYTFDQSKPYAVTHDPRASTTASPKDQVCIWVRVHRLSGNDAGAPTRKCTP